MHGNRGSQTFALFFVINSILFDSSASWVKQMTSGTAISDAISIARFSSNECEQKYSGCKLKFKSFEHILETVLSTLS